MSFEFKAVQPEISDEAKNLAKKYGYRPYMIARYFSMFGSEETQEFLDANEQLSPLSLRVNTLKSDPQSCIRCIDIKRLQIKTLRTYPVCIFYRTRCNERKNNI